MTAVFQPSEICPRCATRGPVRLGAGEVCAQCRTAEAWSRAERELKVVVTHADVDAALKKRQGERPRPPLVAAALALAALALGVAAGIMLLPLRHPLPLVSLDALLDMMRRESRPPTLLGGAAAILAVVALWRLRKGRHFRRWPFLVAYLTTLVLGTGAGIVGGMHWQAAAGQPVKYLTMPARADRAVPSPIFERIAAATVVLLAPNEEGDARGYALGTGAIIARTPTSAWVVTCSHVAMPYAAVASFRHARDARQLLVQLSDGRSAVSTVRWTATPPLDVALIEVPLPGAPEPVSISPDTGNLSVGESVMFVPNPYRDGWLFHRGNVVARDRHDTPAGIYELVVTSLPVQPGDSGSGLYDKAGLLVGLNTWLSRDVTGSVGISLPSEALRAITEAIGAGQLDALDDKLYGRRP